MERKGSHVPTASGLHKLFTKRSTNFETFFNFCLPFKVVDGPVKVHRKRNGVCQTVQIPYFTAVCAVKTTKTFFAKTAFLLAQTMLKLCATVNSQHEMHGSTTILSQTANIRWIQHDLITNLSLARKNFMSNLHPDDCCIVRAKHEFEKLQFGCKVGRRTEMSAVF